MQRRQAQVRVLAEERFLCAVAHRWCTAKGGLRRRCEQTVAARAPLRLQGCPSLVHDAGDGAVGATDLLRGAEREVLLVDLKQGMGAVAAHVEELLLEVRGHHLAGRSSRSA